MEENYKMNLKKFAEQQDNQDVKQFTKVHRKMAEDEEKGLKRKKDKLQEFEREEADRQLNELAKYFKRRQMNKFVPFDTQHSKFALQQYYFLCRGLVLPPFNDVHYEFLYQIQINKKKTVSKAEILIPINELYHIRPTKNAERTELRDSLVEMIMTSERRPEFREQMPDSFCINGSDLIQWFWWFQNVIAHVSSVLFHKFTNKFHLHRGSQDKMHWYQLWEKLHEIVTKYGKIYKKRNDYYNIKQIGKNQDKSEMFKKDEFKNGKKEELNEKLDETEEKVKTEGNIISLTSDNAGDIIDLEDTKKIDTYVLD